MNKEVNISIAKKLHEIGFKEECSGLYFQDVDKKWNVSYPQTEFKRWYRKEEILAPTIAEVVMWLYEKHEIWIQVKPGGKLETWDFITQKKDNTFAVPYFEIKQHKPFFNSPTEAYEAAIEYVLNVLI